MEAKQVEEIKDIAFDKAVERFPYSDEGDLEDDIDAAKRFIYQMAFIKGYEYALASLPKPIGWIKCSDRLPEVGNWYLVFDGRKCFEGFLDTGLPDTIWLDHNGDLPEETVISHWANLPDLPKESEGGK